MAVFSLLPGEVLVCIKESDWQTRVQGISDLKTWWTGNDAGKNQCENIIRFVKKNVKDFKESNVQINREVMDLMCALPDLDPSGFNKTCAALILNGLADKVADTKLKNNYFQLGKKFSQHLKDGPKFVASQLSSSLTSSKNPKVITGILNLVEELITDFGLEQFDVTVILSLAKTPLDDKTKTVRSAAISVLVLMHRFVGPKMISLLSEVKAATLKEIQDLCDKNTDPPPEPTLICFSSQPISKNNIDKSKIGTTNLMDCLPRNDITKELGACKWKVLLDDAAWKVRIKGVETIKSIITGPGKSHLLINGLQPLIHDISSRRLKEGNIAVLKAVLDLVAILGESLGPACKTVAKSILPPMMLHLGFKNIQIRDAAEVASNSWLKEVGSSMWVTFGATPLLTAQPQSIDTRQCILATMGKETFDMQSLDAQVGTTLLPTLVEGLQERAKKARDLADAVILKVIPIVGMEPLLRIINDLKPASRQSLQSTVERYAETVNYILPDASSSTSHTTNTNIQSSNETQSLSHNKSTSNLSSSRRQVSKSNAGGVDSNNEGSRSHRGPTSSSMDPQILELISALKQMNMNLKDVADHCTKETLPANWPFLVKSTITPMKPDQRLKLQQWIIKNSKSNTTLLPPAAPSTLPPPAVLTPENISSINSNSGGSAVLGGEVNEDACISDASESSVIATASPSVPTSSRQSKTSSSGQRAGISSSNGPITTPRLAPPSEVLLESRRALKIRRSEKYGTQKWPTASQNDSFRADWNQILISDLRSHVNSKILNSISPSCQDPIKFLKAMKDDVVPCIRQASQTDYSDDPDDPTHIWFRVTCSMDLLLKLLTIRLAETNPKVVISACDLLKLLFEGLARHGELLTDFESMIIVPNLVERLGSCSSPSIREIIKQSLSGVAAVYPSDKLCQIYLNYGLSSSNSRSIMESLDEIGCLIAADGVAVFTHLARGIARIAPSVNSQDGKIKQVALGVMEKIYHRLGDELWDHKPVANDEKIRTLIWNRVKHSANTNPRSPGYSRADSETPGTPMGSTRGLLGDEDRHHRRPPLSRSSLVPHENESYRPSTSNGITTPRGGSVSNTPTQCSNRRRAGSSHNPQGRSNTPLRDSAISTPRGLSSSGLQAPSPGRAPTPQRAHPPLARRGLASASSTGSIPISGTSSLRGPTPPRQRSAASPLVRTGGIASRSTTPQPSSSVSNISGGRGGETADAEVHRRRSSTSLMSGSAETSRSTTAQASPSSSRPLDSRDADTFKMFNIASDVYNRTTDLLNDQRDVLTIARCVRELAIILEKQRVKEIQLNNDNNGVTFCLDFKQAQNLLSLVATSLMTCLTVEPINLLCAFWLVRLLYRISGMKHTISSLVGLDIRKFFLSLLTVLSVVCTTQCRSINHEELFSFEKTCDSTSRECVKELFLDLVKNPEEACSANSIATKLNECCIRMIRFYHKPTLLTSFFSILLVDKSVEGHSVTLLNPAIVARSIQKLLKHFRYIYIYISGVKYIYI
eukprot:GHVL01034485.1.p1 GENE.GHVL01034485.1~~GHVL01034485.1.p1  ORF type:complete len:1569 (+),score=315.01 GHVL01034485.1:196-4707(+)